VSNPVVEKLYRVLVLEMSADDYLTKPFSVAELGALIKALFRRGGEYLQKMPR
jgi:DNA-binding response OmpR family regulator